MGEPPKFPEAKYGSNYALLRLPLVNAEGQSLWYERFGPAEIERVRAVSGESKFQSQMLLKAGAAVTPRLNGEAVRGYDGEIECRYVRGKEVYQLAGKPLAGYVCWWDPALGGGDIRQRRDGSVVALVYYNRRGDFFIEQVVWLEYDPQKSDGSLHQCEQVARFLEENGVGRIHIEGNGLGAFLPGILRRVLAERQQQVAVVKVMSKGNKNERIVKALEARLANGNVYASKAVREGQLMEEMEDYSPVGSSNRDDGLDAVSQAINHSPSFRR